MSRSMTDADGTQDPGKPEVGTNSLTLDNNGTITVTLKEAAKSDTKIDVTVKQLNGNFSMVEAITVKQGDSSATAIFPRFWKMARPMRSVLLWAASPARTPLFTESNLAVFCIETG